MSVVDWINQNPMLSLIATQIIIIALGVFKFGIWWKYERHSNKCSECDIRRGSGNRAYEYDKSECDSD